MESVIGSTKVSSAEGFRIGLSESTFSKKGKPQVLAFCVVTSVDFSWQPRISKDRERVKNIFIEPLKVKKDTQNNAGGDLPIRIYCLGIK
jgi:hypothetical protein